MRDDKEMILDLEEKIKILEKALQFYGRAEHYGDHNYWTIVMDEGRTARRALKEAADYGKKT